MPATLMERNLSSGGNWGHIPAILNADVVVPSFRSGLKNGLWGADIKEFPILKRIETEFKYSGGNF
jgi:hypothetical protein